MIKMAAEESLVSSLRLFSLISVFYFVTPLESSERVCVTMSLHFAAKRTSLGAGARGAHAARCSGRMHDGKGG